MTTTDKPSRRVPAAIIGATAAQTEQHENGREAVFHRPAADHRRPRGRGQGDGCRIAAFFLRTERQSEPVGRRNLNKSGQKERSLHKSSRHAV